MKIIYSGDLIIITSKIYKGNSFIDLKLALDTGSTHTIIQPVSLKAIGYNWGNNKNQLSITTGSKTEKAFDLKVDKFETFGFEVNQFRVIGKSFPLGLYFIDGLLGLDFFQAVKKTLVLDFKNDEINLS